MSAATRRRGAATVAVALTTLAAGGLRADVLLPPWAPEEDVPPPPGARSVVPARAASGAPGDLVLFAGPSRTAPRRGVTAAGATLPFFGQKRGSGCSGEWWLVGPLAWACSDDATLAPDDPIAPERPLGPSGLPFSYAFVRASGTSAYADLDSAVEGTSDRDLEVGWGVAIVGQHEAGGKVWARTSKGLWIDGADLAPARPSPFHGQALETGTLDLAWVRADRGAVWAAPPVPGKPFHDRPVSYRARFEVVRPREQVGAMLHLDDGTWMLSSDLARPSLAAPPAEVGDRPEPWIDVELASQTLVAYRGTRPVYATLVSTGRPGAETRTGVHRIWVKLTTSDMASGGSGGGGDDEPHYSLEEVPFVQFFDDATALHGAYWHGDFGHARSHGCVNLAPLDAAWLFDFTGPRLPAGWVAVYPAAPQDGAVVRVR